MKLDEIWMHSKDQLLSSANSRGENTCAIIYFFFSFTSCSKSPENLRMAKQLSNNSRYIDDIGVCNMNNNNDFMICSKDIYPESIPLTTGYIENDKDTFLDLDIAIEENRFITRIYHKVDDFDFEVVSFSFPTSNISNKYVT